MFGKGKKKICFVFDIADKFALKEKDKAVVVGHVRKGVVRMGDTVILLKPDGTEREAQVMGIEVQIGMIKSLSRGGRGGIGLNGLNKSDIEIGDQLVKYK